MNPGEGREVLPQCIFTVSPVPRTLQDFLYIFALFRARALVVFASSQGRFRSIYV